MSMSITNLTQQEIIADQNDLFRQYLKPVCIWKGHLIIGKVICTSGVAALPAEIMESALEKVREFSEFTPDNDPHREHDFGKITVGPEDEQETVFWKFDYYSSDAYECGSTEPQDPQKARRVLTIMLAAEY